MHWLAHRTGESKSKGRSCGWSGSSAGVTPLAILTWGQRRVLLLLLLLLLLLHHIVLLLLVLLLLHLARACLRLHLIGIARRASILLHGGVRRHCCLLPLQVLLLHRRCCCGLLLEQHPCVRLLLLHGRVLLRHGGSVCLLRRLGLLLQAAAVAVQRWLLSRTGGLLLLLQMLCLLRRTRGLLSSQRRPASPPGPTACLCLPAKGDAHGAVKEAQVAAQQGHSVCRALHALILHKRIPPVHLVAFQHRQRDGAHRATLQQRKRAQGGGWGEGATGGGFC